MANARIIVIAPHGDDGFNFADSFGQSLAESNCFCTNRDASDVGFDMNAGNHQAGFCPQGRANVMVVRLIARAYHALRVLDKFQIRLGDCEAIPKRP